jgi:hypothetical protein
MLLKLSNSWLYQSDNVTINIKIVIFNPWTKKGRWWALFPLHITLRKHLNYWKFAFCYIVLYTYLFRESGSSVVNCTVQSSLTCETGPTHQWPGVNNRWSQFLFRMKLYLPCMSSDPAIHRASKAVLTALTYLKLKVFVPKRSIKKGKM